MMPSFRAFWLALACAAHAGLWAFTRWQNIPIIPEICLFLAAWAGGALVAHWRRGGR